MQISSCETLDHDISNNLGCGIDFQIPPTYQIQPLVHVYRLTNVTTSCLLLDDRLYHSITTLPHPDVLDVQTRFTEHIPPLRF